MTLKEFRDDKEIIQYLKTQIGKIDTLNECRLFREEQLQISEEMLYFRNCIEWIIRSNQIIVNIKYALTRCLKFSEAMSWPLEETENKRLYSYYLEDAVYRNLVLWDIFKQLLNEFHKCGYSEKNNINIFDFLKEKKLEIGNTKVDNILNYLDSQHHQMVRKTLRNSFTHSVEATSSYVFHRNASGKIQPQIDYLLPNHPFENLNFVIMDALKAIEFVKELVNEMYEYRNTNLTLLEVETVMPCGKEVADPEYWSLGILKEKYEQIIIPCETPCEKSHLFNGNCVCKPTNVNYHRINSKDEQTSGVLIPKMTYAEIEAKFGKTDNRIIEC